MSFITIYDDFIIVTSPSLRYLEVGTQSASRCSSVPTFFFHNSLGAKRRC